MVNLLNIVKEQMTSIGFRHHSTDNDAHKTIITYKYYPSYLVDKYYVFISYVHRLTNTNEFNLFIADNEFNRYEETLFQIIVASQWEERLLFTHINNLFQAEIRTLTINEILADD